MKRDVIAFITPEVAIDQELHTYTGGLGVFSGGVSMAAKKTDLPLVIFTILTRQGYYDQGVNERGMTISYVNRYYDDILEKTGIKFAIEICRSPVWLEVKRLPAEKFNSTEIYFLDADIPKNDFISRKNTLQQYGGSYESGANVERKIAQSLILGKGSIEAPPPLDMNVRLYHINESHGVFAAIQLLSSLLANGISLDDAIRRARPKVAFTTHTPVSAGNPKYDIDTVNKITGYDSAILHKCGGNPFDMTAAGFYLAGKSNAVSKKHLETAKKLWHWAENVDSLIYITNGTSQDFWQYPEFKEAKTPHEIRLAKEIYKQKLAEFVKGRTGFHLKDILTVVWARRFEEYKRPNLIFYNFEWFRHHLLENKIQLIFAGKPHPDNHMMINVWNDIFRLNSSLPNLVIMPEYDLEMSKILKAGADIWLNTPRAPYEACGTSGMSGAMNGAIHMSTPAGWVCEANPENCFIFGSNQQMGYGQDAFDANELVKCLEKAIPTFYLSKDEWYEKALAAKIEAEEHWTSDRMVKEYNELLYGV